MTMRKTPLRLLASLIAVIRLADLASAASPEDLIYTDNGDTLTVRGCSRTAAGSLVIPASVDGKPVTAIGLAAFSSCSYLTSVSMPAGITDIGDQAFYLCHGLKSMSLPSALTNIGDEAFLYCDGLTSLKFQSNVTDIGAYAFAYCTKLKSIVLPPKVSRINRSAFMTCAVLREVTFLGNAPYLGSGVFNETDPDFTLYSYKGRSGFASPTWRGYPMVRLDPEITVQQPVGTGLVDGFSTKKFGSVKTGKSSAARTFTIQNKGSTPLEGLKLTKAGTNPKDFAVTQLETDSLDPGDTTTFQIRFKPGAAGPRSAIIRIPSNDRDENPFDIQVSGYGQ